MDQCGSELVSVRPRRQSPLLTYVSARDDSQREKVLSLSAARLEVRPTTGAGWGSLSLRGMYGPSRRNPPFRAVSGFTPRPQGFHMPTQELYLKMLALRCDSPFHGLSWGPVMVEPSSGSQRLACLPTPFISITSSLHARELAKSA